MAGSGPKGEDIPPHPRQEPRFEGDLTAEHIRFIFRDCADFGERESHRRGPGEADHRLFHQRTGPQ